MIQIYANTWKTTPTMLAKFCKLNVEMHAIKINLYMKIRITSGGVLTIVRIMVAT